MQKLTHRELVEIGYRWLLKNTTCGIAFKELNTAVHNREYPDVIGFGSGGHSIMIECKTSRSDFLADKKKSFRKSPTLGMGSRRFYLCPEGLIKANELPDGWGLIYVSDKGKARCNLKPWKGNATERRGVIPKNIQAEHELMYSALRRISLRGHLDSIYDKQNY